MAHALLVMRARVASITLSLLASLASPACKKDVPSTQGTPAQAGSTSTATGAMTASTADGDIPTAEAFCSHIDKLSMAQLGQMPGSPEEKKQMVADGHASCVAASSEDRKNYPEWGPCARCAMTVDDLGTMEQKCDALCKALGDKLDKKNAPGPSK